MFKSLVASAGFLLLAAAHAADAPPSQSPAQSVAVPASAAASAPALVCRRETPTGSTISHKVCRTQEEIEAEGRLTDEAKRRIQYEAGVAQQQRLKGQ